MRSAKSKKAFPILRFIGKVILGMIKLIIAIGAAFINLTIVIALAAKATAVIIRVLLFPLQFLHTYRQMKESMETDKAEQTWSDLSAMTLKTMLAKK